MTHHAQHSQHAQLALTPTELLQTLSQCRWFLEHHSQVTLEYSVLHAITPHVQLLQVTVHKQAEPSNQYLVPVQIINTNANPSLQTAFNHPLFLKWVCTQIKPRITIQSIDSIEYPNEKSTNPVVILNQTLCLKFNPRILTEENRELLFLQTLTSLQAIPKLEGFVINPKQHCFCTATRYEPNTQSAWDSICTLLKQDNIEEAQQCIAQISNQVFALHSSLREHFAVDRGYDNRKQCYYDSLAAALRYLDHGNVSIHTKYLPSLQVIHGDLHLGQILTDSNTISQFRKILDFEGAPLESLQVRNRLRSPLHDIAGILRSLDYAILVCLKTNHSQTPNKPLWNNKLNIIRTTLENQFLSTYFGESLIPERRVLTKLYCLQRAIYEVEYEKVSRPDWVHIPQQGVERLKLEIIKELK
jgi:hypothetical protein